MKIRLILLFSLCAISSIAYGMNDLKPPIARTPSRIKVIAPLPRGIRVVPPTSSGSRVVPPIQPRIRLLAPCVLRAANASIILPHGPRWLSQNQHNTPEYLSSTQQIKSAPYIPQKIPVAAAIYIISRIAPAYW